MTCFKIISVLFFATVAYSSIYTTSVPRIEGGNYSISNCAGKKILIVTLPVQYNASAEAFLVSLDSLGNAHTDSLSVIAVPAYEDGFTDSNKIALRSWYRSKLGNNILITDGLYTRKTSGTQQHPLFGWLTRAAENGILDIDVEGPGYKFFVDGKGVLIGLLRPETRIGSQTVTDLIMYSAED